MAQQKIGLFAQLTPTGVDSSAANKFNGIAGLSNQVGELAFNKAAKIRQKEGALAGAKSVKRDKDGEIITPNLENDFTIYGQSFNRSAILAHKAEVSMDVREDLDRLQNQYSLDPEAFKSASSGVKKGVLDGMPEDLAIIISQDFDASVSNRHSKLLDNQFKRESAQQRATALNSMESLQDELLTAVRDGDDERRQSLVINASSELDAWVESGKITADESRKIKEDTAERIQEQEAIRGIEEIVFNEDLTLDEQFDKGSDFVKSLRKTTLKELSPEQKDSLVRVVESKLNDVSRKRAAQQKDRDIVQEKIISNLKIETNRVVEKAKNGEFADLSSITEQTEDLHNRGVITKSERTSMLGNVAKARDEISRITLADKRIVARLKGDNSVEMNKKDVDFYYKRNLQDDISQLEPEMQSVANAEFILRTRTIPSKIKTQITSQVLSGDPAQIKQASDLVDRIDNIPGLSNLAVDASQRAFMDSVVKLSQSMQPEQAVQLSKELTDPRDKARTDHLESVIKSDKLRENYSSVVENGFENFFGGDLLQNNVNKQAVEAEYATLFESFFKAGMPKGAAEAKAIEILQNNWKESDFGFMKYRPEDYYSVAGETGYIKDQLAKDVGSENFIGRSFEKDNLFLMSDDTTARKAAEGSPDYRVLGIDQNGEFFTFPGRWAPNSKIELTRQQDKNIEALKEKRRPKIEESKRAAKTLEGLKL